MLQSAVQPQCCLINCALDKQTCPAPFVYIIVEYWRGGYHRQPWKLSNISFCNNGLYSTYSRLLGSNALTLALAGQINV
jgi:hypothetical protein